MAETTTEHTAGRGCMPPRIEKITSPDALLKRLKERLALSAVSRILTPRIYERAVDEFVRRTSRKR